MKQHTTLFKNNQKQIAQRKKLGPLPTPRQIDSLQSGRNIWPWEVSAVPEQEKPDPVRTFSRALYAISFLLMLLFVLSTRMAQAQLATEKEIIVKLRN